MAAPAATMSSVQAFRGFLGERLSAAAAEIFTVFERTVVRYEEQLQLQRRKLELTETKLREAGNTQQLVSGWEQLCNQENNVSVDQENPEANEEQMDPFIMKGEPEVKQESGAFMELPADGGSGLSEADGKELPPHSSVTEFSSNQLAAAADGKLSELKPFILKVGGGDLHHQQLSNIWQPQIKLHRIDLPQIHAWKEQQLCNMETTSSLCQEEPAPPQIKEEPLHAALEDEDSVETPHGDGSEDRKLQPDTVKELVTNFVPDESHTAGRSYLCSVCGDRFRQKGNLIVHNRIHTAEMPYACSVCGKRFRHSSTFKVHQRIHTGERPYSCSDCGKSFTRKSKLNDHNRIHTGEKLYSCAECSKSFGSLDAFITHKRIHTDDKPFSCSECGKRFIVKDQLKNHKRTHSGEKPFSCAECSLNFSWRSTFYAHMRSHTGENPFSCSECGKRFNYKGSLVKHIRSHKGKKPLPAQKVSP